MFEALFGVIWTIIKDKVEPRAAAAINFVIVPTRRWFSGLAKWAKCIVFLAAATACIALCGFALSIAGVPVVATLNDLTTAFVNTRSAPLSPHTKERISLYVSAWSQILFDDYERRVAAQKTGTRSADETAWALAQESMAIEGVVFNGRRFDGREIFNYVEADSEEACNCWREIEFPDQTFQHAYPRHVGISAWIVVDLARLGPVFPATHLQFLEDAQLRNGAWPMLYTKDDNQGSTFATPWAILALMNASARINNAEQEQKIAMQVSDGINWLLGEKTDGQLWTLYPDLQNSNAQELSVSNTGLAIFALHQAARINSLEGRPLISSRWLERLKSADRDLLRHLRVGIEIGAADQYNSQLKTASDGLAVDRIQLLVLPWLLIGTVDAYGSGGWQERLNGVRFLDDIESRLDVIDLELRKPDNMWIMPEMLMALRYWSDAAYLRQLPESKDIAAR